MMRLGYPRAKRVGAQSQILGQTGPEVHQRDVRLAQERGDHRFRAWVPQGQRQRLLAAVAREVCARLAWSELPQAPYGVAFECLDLDHPSAAFGQQLGTEGDGDELAELHDGDAVEWLVGCHYVSCRSTGDQAW